MSDFEKEEKLKAGLETKFPGSVTNASVQRKNRLWLDAAAEKLPESSRLAEGKRLYPPFHHQRF